MKPIFRSAMFGFHKDDVANFIAQQNRQFEAKVSDLKEQMELAQQKFEQEKEAFLLDQDELSTLREKEAAHRSDFGRIEQLVNTIHSKEEALSSAFSESAVAVANVGEDVSRLKEKLANAKELRQKANRFDQLTSLLGEIVSGKKSDQTQKTENVEEAEQDITSIDEALSLLTKERELLVSLQESCTELSALLAQIGSEK